MRTVHFLIANEQRHWGSSILRGEQLRDLCDRFLGGGGGLEFRIAREPETLRNAIVFVTKGYLVFAPMEDLAALKERGNFLIGDFLDARIDAARAELCDTLVVSSRNQDAFLRAAFPERRFSTTRTTPIYRPTLPIFARSSDRPDGNSHSSGWPM